MSHRLLSPLLTLTLATLAACTDAPAPDTTDQTQAIDYQCLSVCFPGLPCHHLCKLILDEPGFVIPESPRTCDELRPINVCGDGCCDAAETNLRDGWCKADCRLQHLEVIDFDGSGKLFIMENDATLGRVEKGYVSVAPVCK
jgi:hypothetical protein